MEERNEFSVNSMIFNDFWEKVKIIRGNQMKTHTVRFMDCGDIIAVVNVPEVDVTDFVFFE